MRGLNCIAALLLFLTATSFARAEQALNLHFTNGEAFGLYAWLGQRAIQHVTPPQEPLPIHYYGDTVNIGCSEYPECFLSVYEKEWKFHREGALDIYDFILPIEGRTLVGRVSINSRGTRNFDLKLTDIVDGTSFHFQNPITCPTSDCSYYVGPRSWKLERQESMYVVQNARRLLLEFSGEEARILFNKSKDKVVAVEFPLTTRVRLGQNLYCFEESQRHYCQAYLRPDGYLSFATPSYANWGFNLFMQSTFEDLMLQRYDLYYQSRSGQPTLLKVCEPKSMEGHTECKHWYDRDADISQPIPDDQPGGIAVGWGRRPLE